MYLQNELKYIAERLFREKICAVPLDEQALNRIYRYMGFSDTGSDLMRRLSDIENNYEQIEYESEQATEKIDIATEKCINIFKYLIDNWNNNGLTDNYSFSISKSNFELMRRDYFNAVEDISTEISYISDACSTLAETSAQLKACSASFLEVFAETKLASYAASLNQDRDNILYCQAIALQAHDSSVESNRKSVRYLSLVQNGMKVISVINNVISEATVYFSEKTKSDLKSSSEILNTFIPTIGTLDRIRRR